MLDLRSSALALALASLVTGMAATATTPARAQTGAVMAEMKDRSGRVLGTVRFTESMAGLLVTAKLKGLPPGPHGFHVYEVGQCEGDFESAGAIYNPLGARHGFLNEEGPMAGDLPNLIVPASGEIEVELLSPFLSLAKQGDEALLDADGASVIIRERADDHRTDPDGDSGARIACGVLKPAR